MIRIEEFVTEEDISPFRRWFDALDHQAAAWVAIAIDRLGEGNTSSAKALGEGVSELRIDRGPGYRIYFGWDGKLLVILLGGGTKKRQQNDIRARCATGVVTRCARQPDEPGGSDHAPDQKFSRNGAGAGRARRQVSAGSTCRSDAGAARR
jgi:putative addiction module killer protein